MILKDYKNIKLERNKYTLTKKEKIGIILFSVLVSIFIVSIPTIVLVNLLIFRDYVKLISLGFGFLLILLFFLIGYFYDIGKTKGNIKNIYVISLRNTIFMSVIVLITLAILFYFEVI